MGILLALVFAYGLLLGYNLRKLLED